MSPRRHRDCMDDLRRRHDALLDLIGGRTVHYVDVPVHGNVGDLLIMQGVESFLSRHAIAVRLRAGFFNYDPTWAEPGDVILFHGGGNLGDLYPGPQRIREETVARLPSHRIVILPQTIHFRDPRAYERCCAVFSRHPDLHVCVRDRTSFALARPMTPHVHLLPDMAHQLWPMRRVGSPRAHRLGLFRADAESAGRSGAAPVDEITDWPSLAHRGAAVPYAAYRAMRFLHGLGGDRRLVDLEMRLWQGHARRLVAEAVRLLSAFETVETDRLHAHLLACLLDLPSVLHDNAYGKNAAYAAAWTAESERVTLAAALRG